MSIQLKPRNISKVEIIGIYGDAVVERISAAFRYLTTIDKELNHSIEYLLPFAFELRCAQLKKDPRLENTDIRFLKSLSSPIIIVNDREYISTAAFFERLRTQYNYSDRTPIIFYHRLGQIKLAKHLQNTGRTYVYLEFLIDHPKHPNPYRVLFELFTDLLPKTCQNFIGIIEENHKNAQEKTLSYRGSTIHRIQPNGFIQGGDVQLKGGAGGESIYGDYFEDESYAVPHDRPGILGMANKGTRHTNNSQFYVTLCRLDHFNKTQVAFGTVVSGFRIIKLINSIPVDNGKPYVNVTIAGCGIHRSSVPKHKK